MNNKPLVDCSIIVMSSQRSHQAWPQALWRRQIGSDKSKIDRMAQSQHTDAFIISGCDMAGLSSLLCVVQISCYEMKGCKSQYDIWIPCWQNTFIWKKEVMRVCWTCPLILNGSATGKLAIANLVYTNIDKHCSQSLCSCVETLVILPAKFHVVSSILTVLKIAILMLSLICPSHSHWKLVWPKYKNMVNLKNGSFVAIMLLHKGLTRVHS